MRCFVLRGGGASLPSPSSSTAVENRTPVGAGIPFLPPFFKAGVDQFFGWHLQLYWFCWNRGKDTSSINTVLLCVFPLVSL